MSGFYTQDIPFIKAECERNSLNFLSYAEKNNWVAVKTQKQR
jgi:ribosomal protein L11 methyltransferase